MTVKRSDLSLENQGSAAAGAGGRTPAYAGGAPATPMHPGAAADAMLLMARMTFTTRSPDPQLLS